ncbi:MAG: radical SAM family heme chaperone HemW [Anaerolineales bacterium]
MNDLSLYLHIPFCFQRCGYCDFNTYAGMDHLIPRYLDALRREIEFYGFFTKRENTPVKLKTIYFGGGTPSRLSYEQFGSVLETISDSFDTEPSAEITIEANPGQLSSELLVELYGMGVNRISLGVQSSDRAELKALDRLHGYPEAVEAVKSARKAGFDNLSMDLIYGIPLQTMQSWENSLKDILALQPEHLSLYSLSVEEGTPLARKVSDGSVSVPEDDLAADMFELAVDVLVQKGFVHYEISTWAKVFGGRTHLSRHNRQYWLNQPYLGLGAGAHGFFHQTRYENVPGLFEYIRMMKQADCEHQLLSPVVFDEVKIDRYREMQETMMMGLRLLQEGITEERFLARFGVAIQEVFGKEVDEFLENGLLERINGTEGFRLSNRGYLLGNRVFGAFV